jgi:ribosomal protein S18 acetylase RimI-like enzyme
MRGIHPPWKPLGLTNLVMENPDITKTMDELPLPENYSLRACSFTEKDIQQLAMTTDMAYGDQHGVWDIQRIRSALIDDATVQGTIVIDYTDPTNGETTIVGCGSMRIRDDKYPGKGYPHWIAVHPAHQGHGLGTIIMKAVHRSFVTSHQLTSAVLETQDPNIPAIAIYLKLGYQPVLSIDTTMSDRWDKILQQIQRK